RIIGWRIIGWRIIGRLLAEAGCRRLRGARRVVAQPIRQRLLAHQVPDGEALRLGHARARRLSAWHTIALRWALRRSILKLPQPIRHRVIGGRWWRRRWLREAQATRAAERHAGADRLAASWARCHSSLLLPGCPIFRGRHWQPRAFTS